MRLSRRIIAYQGTFATKSQRKRQAETGVMVQGCMPLWTRSTLCKVGCSGPSKAAMGVICQPEDTRQRYEECSCDRSSSASKVGMMEV